MPDQTPPAVTEEQFQKMIDVVRGLVRKDGITGPEFQHVLGHPGFAKGLGFITDLVTGYRQSLPLLERTPFLTVRVGTLKSEVDYRRALGETDPIGNISQRAGDIMSKPDFAASIPHVEEDVEFIIASNEELGYPKGCTRLQTYEAGLKLGWKLCLASDGPEIRRHYLDQPMNEWLLVAMEPIADSVGDLRVFIVERDDGGAWLGSSYDGPGSVWDAGDRWVFRRK